MFILKYAIVFTLNDYSFHFDFCFLNGCLYKKKGCSGVLGFINDVLITIDVYQHDF